jgi:2-oxo-4-hydroxy-4-carboxy-5-ureidoimidazoline decarboxylase
VTLAALNRCSRDAFVDAVGWTFEKSPWVAERACDDRPFADLASLHRAMTTVVQRAAPHEQLALVRAHPDLGTRLAMSAASTSEQAVAGFAELPVERLARLAALNAEYREKFGFPFLFAVKGSTPDEVLASLERRLPRDPEEEFDEALLQVCRIAGFRLADVVREES